MGKLNLVSGAIRGTVGQMTGQKWKDQKIIKSKPIPTYTRTTKQNNQRLSFQAAIENYGDLAILIKPYTNLKTTKNTLRSVLMTLNKKVWSDEEFDWEDVQLSTGSLPPPINCTWEANQMTDETTLHVRPTFQTDKQNGYKYCFVFYDWFKRTSNVWTLDPENADLRTQWLDPSYGDVGIFTFTYGKRNGKKVASRTLQLNPYL